MKTLLLLSLFIGQALAITEADFERVYENEVIPYYEKANSIFFKNKQGHSLHTTYYQKDDNSKALVILPGRTEPVKKYAELLYDLRHENVDIFILDHLGQGESDRLLKDSQKGHIRHFSQYVEDMDLWMNEVVLPQVQGKEIYLFSHSMGGAVAALYMSSHPNLFKKALLSAPMFEINTSPYSEFMAKLISKTLCLIGRGKSYAPGTGPYILENEIFETNKLTRSEKRFEMTKKLFSEQKNLIIAGPTSRWVFESIKATRKIDRLASKIETPLIILQAEKDLIVKLPRQNVFCEKAKTCSTILFPDSFHEIFMEKDQIRDRAMNIMKEFLN